MKQAIISRVFAVIFSTATMLLASSGGMAHETGGGAHNTGSHAKSPDLGTSAAVDRKGRLWLAMTEAADGKKFVVLQTSDDHGKTWSAPARILRTPEPVAASGEARPHIAFGNNDEIYVTYTRTIAKPHVGDIRFVRSVDGGKTFSDPITLHDNKDVITHSFETMVIDAKGRIFVAWIDGRDSEKAKTAKRKYAGSALYYAVSDDQGASFKGDYKIADNVCECCRIAMAIDPQGEPVAMWRHIFSGSIRDHATAVLTADGKSSSPERVTFDNWKVDACPHHGPSLVFDAAGNRHQVWFDVKDGEGGAFYSATSMQAVSDKSDKAVKAVALGSAQAEHPDVAVSGKAIAVAWKSFDGKATHVLGRVSLDGGKSWKEQEFGMTAGPSDQPHLVTSPDGIVLIWRTQADGIKTVFIARESA
jgi:hypothetical protein